MFHSPVRQIYSCFKVVRISQQVKNHTYFNTTATTLHVTVRRDDKAKKTVKYKTLSQNQVKIICQKTGKIISYAGLH